MCVGGGCPAGGAPHRCWRCRRRAAAGRHGRAAGSARMLGLRRGRRAAHGARAGALQQGRWGRRRRRRRTRTADGRDLDLCQAQPLFDGGRVEAERVGQPRARLPVRRGAGGLRRAAGAWRRVGLPGARMRADGRVAAGWGKPRPGSPTWITQQAAKVTHLLYSRAAGAGERSRIAASGGGAATESAARAAAPLLLRLESWCSAPARAPLPRLC